MFCRWRRWSRVLQMSPNGSLCKRMPQSWRFVLSRSMRSRYACLFKFYTVLCIRIHTSSTICDYCTSYYRIYQGWEYRYSNIDILKLFSVIFWISIYWNSSQANFSIISIYWNSSQANFSIISIYEIQAKPISVLYRYTEIQAKPISIFPKLATLYAIPC